MVQTHKQVQASGCIIHANKAGSNTLNGVKVVKRSDELDWLTQETFRVISEPYEDVIQRAPPKIGTWSQWEMICERQ